MRARRVEVRSDDLTRGETVRFLESHLDDMKQITPPGSVHALGVDALRAPDITLWSAWDRDVLLGCGALKALDPESGEIKAMRTDEAHRRRGIAAAILERIVEEARRRGYCRLCLETGALPAFAPARAFYRRHGFVIRGPFGDYGDDPNSVFMQREL